MNILKKNYLVFVMEIIILFCLIPHFSLKDEAYFDSQNYDHKKMQYKGEYKKNKFEGKGVLKMENGDKYEGEFKNGRFNRTGIFISHEGWSYEGEFRNGKPNGYGKLSLADHSIYEGKFVNGVLKEHEN